MYYKVRITETGRNSLKEEASIFNVENQSFKTLEDATAYLKDRYGSIPKLKEGNTIYEDRPGGVPVAVGFLKSYWNKDISHNSKSWYQTDWVIVSGVNEEPVLV